MGKRTLRENVIDGSTVAVAAAALLLAGLMIADRRSGTPDTSPVPVPGWEKYLESGHQIGSESAPVSMVVFADYECPACRAFERTLGKVIAAEPDRFKVVHRHWPLDYHPHAYAAARAAECAGEQGVFQEYHRRLYAASSLSSASWNEIAGSIPDLDDSTFAACMAREGPVAAIEKDVDAARQVGGTGTPTILINGLRLRSLPDSAALASFGRK